MCSRRSTTTREFSNNFSVQFIVIRHTLTLAMKRYRERNNYCAQQLWKLMESSCRLDFIFITAYFLYMKTFYFIRHGESHANRSFYLQQTGDTPLTKKGIRQAQEAGRHLKRLNVQGIISSTFARAKATAEEIGRETGVPIEYSELLVERRRPGIQLAKPKLHPSWLWAQTKLALFSKREGYRHSDEETPTEQLERADAVLKLLANRPEEYLIVVTHGRFMRAIYAHIILGDGLTAHAYLRLTRTLRMRNTALMVATYEESAGWTVTAWDMHAHEL